MKEASEPVCFGHERDGTKDSCSACATRLVPYLRAQLEQTQKEFALRDQQARRCANDYGDLRSKLSIATEALEAISTGCTGRDTSACEYADIVLEQLKDDRPDTSVLEARAGGLDKAAEICRYHAGLPMRNEASKAMARDIETSCLATAGRIRRGEYENPTSDVMQTEGDSQS